MKLSVHTFVKRAAKKQKQGCVYELIHNFYIQGYTPCIVERGLTQHLYVHGLHWSEAKQQGDLSCNFHYQLKVNHRIDKNK